MRTNFFFWLYTLVIVIVALSITISSLRSISLTTVVAAVVGPRDGAFELGIFKSLVKDSGLDDILSVVTQIMHRRSCDEKKWKSELISMYNVSLTSTVDLKGCANFSSVQKAVDAVPNHGSSRTLILIDSGIYRSSSYYLPKLIQIFQLHSYFFLDTRAVEYFCFKHKFLGFNVRFSSFS